MGDLFKAQVRPIYQVVALLAGLVGAIYTAIGALDNRIDKGAKARVTAHLIAGHDEARRVDKDLAALTALVRRNAEQTEKLVSVLEWSKEYGEALQRYERKQRLRRLFRGEPAAPP